MKLFSLIPKSRRIAGILLIECVTYMAVFAILTGIGMAAFYLCWDQSKALVYATDDIGAALRAGERWRADVRNATGKISVESSAAGQVVRIPGPDKEVIYRFQSGEVRRETPGSQNSYLLLARVNTSQIRQDARTNVTAWHWELELQPRPQETQLPLLFTFAAAQKQP